MIKEKTITLQADFMEDGQCFIWAETKDHFAIPVESWVHHAFAWHEETFFGSVLEETVIDGKTGVRLSPWTALDFFARAPQSSLLDITLGNKAILYRAAAKKLFQAIEEGAFLPDFEKWKEGKFGWKLSENKLENEWLTAALYDLFEKENELQTAWTALTEQYPLIKSENKGIFGFNETFWLERIGWRKDDSPFTVGLRLTEPEEDEEDWVLEILLRGKANADQVVVWNGDESALPKNWKGSLGRIQTESNTWFQTAPWLKGDNNSIRTTLSEAEAWLFLTETSLALAEIGTEVLLPSWWKDLQENSLKLKIQVKSSVGQSQNSFVGLDQLIDFDWKVATGGLELSEEEFRALVDNNRRLINIRGKWVRLDPNFVKQMQAVMKKVNESGLTFADVLAKELLPEEDREQAEEDAVLQGITLELNRHLRKMIKQLTETKHLPEQPVPKGLNGELRPYQKKGMEWLLFLERYGLGGLLADDMGLGKTVQTIAYYLSAKEQGARLPMLIICPTSVLGNWHKEVERFAPDLNVKLHYGAKRANVDTFPAFLDGVDVVLTSYNLAHLDEEVLTSVHWHAVCLDEAQNIKNTYTKQAKAVKKLKANHRIALTGTPIENRLTELWSIFDFLNPGYFGSLSHFREHYVNPVEREEDKQKMKDVQQLIRPFFMRRSKRDPDIELNLPDKQEQKEYCPLTAEQASLYEQTIEDTFKEIEKRSGIERRGAVLSMLTKLKQICNHPSLFLKEEKAENILSRSHKTEKLVDLVSAIRDQQESCLIFTQYISMGNMLSTLLADTFGEPVSFLHGGIQKETRDKMIERFQNGEEKIMILSLKAGGTGLNLTTANHVIHYDRWWNPAVENQATDRAHRIGQKRFVHVHKLITTGTLEEKIDEMLERKQSLSDGIIQSENWITELPTEELRELFALR
ncbi:ATP-dependent helicase [Pueribacillus theae]|uniref:ATP-dependent helicase n=1 Tax=Pueribacillus theae TaxID=2171751 RepID=A0A2U1JTE3_9BACI|nr:DEAD/DEAH box helicase [Pueribacillus theae]PWA08392.1 ATP-dependent helicase [Pueribacillus theae]